MGLLAIFVACIVTVVPRDRRLGTFLRPDGPLGAAVRRLHVLFLFRDPEARVPSGAGLVLSPSASRKVDAIGQTNEPKFMGGPCQRVSIFLSVIDIHVQNAPLSGKIAFFSNMYPRPVPQCNLLKAESAEHNENVLLGIESLRARAGQKIGLRLIAAACWRVADRPVRGRRR